MQYQRPERIDALPMAVCVLIIEGAEGNAQDRIGSTSGTTSSGSGSGSSGTGGAPGSGSGSGSGSSSSSSSSSGSSSGHVYSSQYQLGPNGSDDTTALQALWDNAAEGNTIQLITQPGKATFYVSSTLNWIGKDVNVIATGATIETLGFAGPAVIYGPPSVAATAPPCTGKADSSMAWWSRT